MKKIQSEKQFEIHRQDKNHNEILVTNSSTFHTVKSDVNVNVPINLPFLIFVNRVENVPKLYVTLSSENS